MMIGPFNSISTMYSVGLFLKFPWKNPAKLQGHPVTSKLFFPHGFCVANHPMEHDGHMKGKSNKAGWFPEIKRPTTKICERVMHFI